MEQDWRGYGYHQERTGQPDFEWTPQEQSTSYGCHDGNGGEQEYYAPKQGYQCQGSGYYSYQDEPLYQYLSQRRPPHDYQSYHDPPPSYQERSPQSYPDYYPYQNLISSYPDYHFSHAYDGNQVNQYGDSQDPSPQEKMTEMMNEMMQLLRTQDEILGKYAKMDRLQTETLKADEGKDERIMEEPQRAGEPESIQITMMVGESYEEPKRTEVSNLAKETEKFPEAKYEDYWPPGWYEEKPLQEIKINKSKVAEVPTLAHEAKNEVSLPQGVMEVDSPQEVENEKEEELMVEPCREVNKRVNHDICMSVSVREPVVDAKTWAPPPLDSIENSCLNNNFRYACINNNIPLIISNGISCRNERYIIEKLREKMQELSGMGPILVLPDGEERPCDEKEREGLPEIYIRGDISPYLSCASYSRLMHNFSEKIKGKCIDALEFIDASRYKFHHLPYTYETFEIQMCLLMYSFAIIGKRVFDWVYIVFDRGKG